MTAPRWMPFYIADYLADTGHLSTTEHGAYLLLIFHYWQNGGLPNDRIRVSRVARMRIQEWARIETTMEALFGPNWTHKRIDRELATAREMIEKRSVAGKIGASARFRARVAEAGRLSQQTHSNGSTNAMANAQQTDSIVRVRNINQDIIPSSVQSPTQAEKVSGSAEKQGEIADPNAGLAPSTGLLNTRMLKRRA